MRPHLQLRRAVRAIIRADSDPSRQALFATLQRSSRAVRLVTWVHARLGRSRAASVLVACYGLRAYLGCRAPRHGGARVLGLAVHANARRQVERVLEWFPTRERAIVGLGPAALVSWDAVVAGVALLRALPTCRRVFRVIRGVAQHHGFLVSCRVAATLGAYARARSLLTTARPGALVVSSDTNPQELAVAAAARTLGVPTVFIAHAYPSAFAPPLDFDLSILEGEAALEARRKLGPVRGQVFFAGLGGETAPMDVRRLANLTTIGLFLPKNVDWQRLHDVVMECGRVLGAKRLLLRWHPSSLDHPARRATIARLPGVVDTPSTAPLAAAARECAVVISDENSNVHLPLLRLGVPTLAIQGLSPQPPGRSDIYRFVKERIVPSPIRSLHEFDPVALASFYDEGWAGRFRRFDAGYLRDPNTIAGAGRRVIEGLIDAPAAMSDGADPTHRVHVSPSSQPANSAALR